MQYKSNDTSINADKIVTVGETLPDGSRKFKTQSGEVTVPAFKEPQIGDYLVKDAQGNVHVQSAGDFDGRYKAV